MACEEGDIVSSGDIIAEIETDKATMELRPWMKAPLANC